MSDQLKAFWNFLFIAFFLLPVNAEPSLDAAKLVESDGQKTLQTIISSVQKDGTQIDLIGVIHIADKEYYKDLNDRLKNYDAVFYEMVGTEAQISALRTIKPEENQKRPQKGINALYTIMKDLLDLSLQSSYIDYSSEKFVHADMLLSEFQSAQRETGESLTATLMGSSIDLSSIDQRAIISAMVNGKSTLLKRELVTLLSTADDAVADGNTSVLVHGRNDKCLEVVNRTLSTDPELKNVAIFYGAAHIPDIYEKLLADGWVHSKTSWLNAWKIPAKKEK